MFNYFESVNLTPESVELYKLWKSVKINSVRVNLTLDFLLCTFIVLWACLDTFTKQQAKNTKIIICFIVKPFYLSLPQLTK